MNMTFNRELFSPQEIKQMYPVTPEAVALKQQNDQEIRSVLSGESDRLLLVIGPCSADKEDSVCDYVSRLTSIQEKVKDKLIIIPRIYTNKPRTTGEGYKGIASQPDPEKAPDNIIAIRRILNTFLPAASTA